MMLLTALLVLSTMVGPAPGPTGSPGTSPTVTPGRHGYDLSVTVTMVKPKAFVGDTLRWRVRITNLGDRPATGLELHGDRTSVTINPQPPGWRCTNAADHPANFACMPPPGTELGVGASITYETVLPNAERGTFYLAMRIEGTDPASDLNPHNNQSEAGVQVLVRPKERPTLPVTGAGTLPLLVAGAGMLGSGTVLLLTARRRRSRTPAGSTEPRA